MATEEYQFQKAWDRYKIQQSLGCFSIIIIVGVIFTLKQIPAYYSQIFGILFFLFLLICVAWYFYKGFWKCPHCKKDFKKYWKGSGMPSKYCENCKLPIYYGSSYFFDYWGMEKGKELIEKIEQGKGIKK